VRDDGRLIHADVFDEAVRLLGAAQEAGLTVRMLGGMAIVLHVGELLHPAFRREIRDIDLATPKRESRKVSEFLDAQGYTPNKTFNAMHGARRLLFYDEPNGRQVDVFVGTFEMCHQLPLEQRLDVEPMTLPLAELVLTKLQIVKLNKKDAYDLYSLLLTHDVAEHDSETINAAWIAELCGRDWGLYHTVALNLERLRTELDVPELTTADLDTIRGRVEQLEEAIERAPKTGKWKLRARVGDRVRWYEDPEEVEKGAY
jgi:putative nucleotidyltransferase-like protein